MIQKTILLVTERLFLASLGAYPASFRRTMAQDLLHTYRAVRGEKITDGFWTSALPFVMKSPILAARDGFLERWTTNRVGTARAGRGRRGGLAHWWHDIRLTVSQNLRAPGFLIGASLTFAVGLGATVTVYSIVDNVMLRPLPYPDSEKLVQLGAQPPNDDRLWSVSLANFTDIAEQTAAFDGMATVRGLSADLSGAGAAERVFGAGVSSQFFPLFGVAPSLGRVFSDAENSVDAENVVVLSHTIWASRYGMDENVIGRAITVNDAPHVVVGVLPEDFQPPAGLGLGEVQIWLPALIPFRDRALSDRSRGMFRVVARVAGSRSIVEAQSELNVVAAGLARSHPDANTLDGQPLGLRIVPLIDQTVGAISSRLVTLLVAVAVILAIAVANLTNLLIVRSVNRRQEFIVKRALGSSTVRLIRPVVLEGVLVTVVGGTIGCALAVVGVAAFRALSPGDIPRLSDVTVDWRVVGVAAILSLTLGAVASLAPALRSTREDPANALRGASRNVAGVGGNLTRQVLVLIQAALAITLSVGAGLLINSFVRLTRVDPGFDVDEVTLMQVLIGNPDIRGSADRRDVFTNQLLQHINEIEGVTSVATTLMMPLQGLEMTSRVSKADLTVTEVGNSGNRHTVSFITWVSPDYFATMGIPFTQSGRDFVTGDVTNTGTSSIIVNEEFARAAWPGQSAVGRQIRIDGGPGSDEPHTIIGVVGNVRNAHLALPDVPSIYYLDVGRIVGPPLNVMVRSQLSTEILVPALRTAVQRVDRTIPVGFVGPLSDVVNVSMSRPRFYMFLLSTFAALAVVLAAVGIYGSVAYSVRQRTREVGVRIACGAPSAGILWLVVRQGLKPVVIGSVIGLVVAAAFTRALQQFLFGITPTDVVTLLGATLFLWGAAACACVIPASRAARIDPVTSLKE